jgi:hypothetical protein
VASITATNAQPERPPRCQLDVNERSAPTTTLDFAATTTRQPSDLPEVATLTMPSSSYPFNPHRDDLRDDDPPALRIDTVHSVQITFGMCGIGGQIDFLVGTTHFDFYSPSTVVFGASYGVCVTIAAAASMSRTTRLVGASQ